MKSSEVKSYTAILVALEGAAGSVRNLLREQANHAVMQQALDEMRKPEHAPALQSMVRGAIAGAATALNFDASTTPTPPAVAPIPDGWPPGWTLTHHVMKGGVVRYAPARMVGGEAKSTAIRYEEPEDARRDAWEWYEQEAKG